MFSPKTSITFVRFSGKGENSAKEIKKIKYRPTIKWNKLTLRLPD